MNKNNLHSDNDFVQYCEMLKTHVRPIQKVLMIQVPQMVLGSFNREVARKKGLYAFPPTGLQYLYESLKTRDLTFRILDLNYELLKKVWEDDTFHPSQWMSLLDDYLKVYDADIICVSCMYDSNLEQFIEVLEFLKMKTKSIVVIGGIIPTYEYEKFLKRELCHFVIRKEGEYKINYLFDHIADENLGHPAIQDIYYMPEKDIKETLGRDFPVIVDTDLTDSYDLLDLKNYYRYGSLNPFSRIANIHDAPYAAIQMSRGCRALCTFCAVRDFMGKGVRSRSVQNVLAEMEYLVEKQGIKHFEWLDDDLLYPKEHIQDLLQRIIDKKWGITWSANNGLIAHFLDEKIMKLIRDSGCIGFKIGIETGNPDMLKKIKKPGSLKTFHEFSTIAQHYPEVFIGGNFMLGFPEETFQQMLDSFTFHLEMSLDWGAFTLCQKIRGATAFDDFKDYFDAQMESGGRSVKNFIPTRQSKNGQMITTEDVKKGFDIFAFDPQAIPSEEQIKEIWFSFNLIGNFMHNKNLFPGGRPEKFIAWVEMAQLAYPTNPYMSLFLSLAYLLKGDEEKSKEFYQKAVNCSQTNYWRERFETFGLDKVLDKFPKSILEVFKTMNSLKGMLKLPQASKRSKLQAISTN